VRPIDQRIAPGLDWKTAIPDEAVAKF
jgi:hypothetical protein